MGVEYNRLHQEIPGTTNGSGEIFRAIGNYPGAIDHELALISEESGITPAMKVDGADGTQAASLLQILSATWRARDKAQAIHLLRGVDRGK